jgi:biopolymer transport protein ExbB
MNETGNSDPYVLAGGISQALVTTAAGLAVAIPAMLALNFFDSFIDRHNEIMDEAISETAMVFEVLYERKKEKKIPG